MTATATRTTPRAKATDTDAAGALCRCGRGLLKSYGDVCESCFEDAQAAAALRRGRAPGLRRCQICSAFLPVEKDRRKSRRVVCDTRKCRNELARVRQSDKRLDERERRRKRKCVVCGVKLDPNVNARKLTCRSEACRKLRIAEHRRSLLPAEATRSRVCPVCRRRFIGIYTSRLRKYCGKKCATAAVRENDRATYLDRKGVKSCTECGKAFRPADVRFLTCSPGCGREHRLKVQRAFHARRKAAVEASAMPVEASGGEAAPRPP